MLAIKISILINICIAGGQTAHTLTLQRNVSMSIYLFKNDDEFIISLKEYYQSNPFRMEDVDITPTSSVAPWNKGKTGLFYHTEESKQKISKASKERIVSEHTKNLKRLRFLGDNNPMYGKKLSEYHKEKLHHKCKLPKTSEHKEKISKSSLNRERKICPYCQKVAAVNMANRWHFKNCKSKPNGN